MELLFELTFHFGDVLLGIFEFLLQGLHFDIHVGLGNMLLFEQVIFFVDCQPGVFEISCRVCISEFRSVMVDPCLRIRLFWIA